MQEEIDTRPGEDGEIEEFEGEPLDDMHEFDEMEHDPEMMDEPDADPDLMDDPAPNTREAFEEDEEDDLLFAEE